jgi:hypothetical protein
MSRIALWSEKLSLEPFEITPSTCCLEPREAISIILTATSPIGVELLDWGSYLQWTRCKRVIPGKFRFSTARELKLRASAEDPPYVVVLLLSNPGREYTDVVVEITSDADVTNGAAFAHQ